MKINEVITENLNEIAFTKKGRQMKRAFKRGQQVISQTVDKMNSDFAEFLGVRGKRNLKQADANDVIDFLNMKKVDVSDIDTKKPMNKKIIQQIFQQKAKEAIQGKATPVATTPKNPIRKEPPLKSPKTTSTSDIPKFKSSRVQKEPSVFKSKRSNNPPEGIN